VSAQQGTAQQQQFNAPRTERPTPLHEPAAPVSKRSRRSVFLVLLGALAFPLIVAAVVYVVSDSITPTYESSASFRVVIPNQAGLNDTVITAANDLATQYSQLATATPVINVAARQLRERPSALKKEITGSTVNAQNLVEVTASAEQGPVAERRADAVITALRAYVDRINVQQSRTYSNNVSEGLAPVEKEIQYYTTQLKQAKTLIERQNLNLLLGSLLAQRQGTLSSLAENAAAGRPTLQGISQQSAADKVRPRPELYALVGGIVAALIAARVAQLMLRRRRGDTAPPLAAA
jgi:K+ transporter